MFDTELESLGDISLTAQQLLDTPPDGARLLEIEVNKIRSRQQIRKVFADIDSLAESLIEQGQLSPINVSADPDNEGMYVIEQGERRWRAAKKAGFATIKCVVVEAPVDEKKRQLQQLTENLQRDNMRPHEIAAVFAQLNRSGMTNADIARALGWTRQRVQIYSDLKEMPEQLMKASEKGEITDATALQTLTRLYRQKGEKAAKKIIEKFRNEDGKLAISRSQARALLKDAPVASKGKEPKTAAAFPVKDKGVADERKSAAPEELAAKAVAALPARVNRCGSTVMSVVVRSHTSTGTKVQRRAAIEPGVVCEAEDMVCVRYEDNGELDVVPCAALTLLSVASAAQN